MSIVNFDPAGVLNLNFRKNRDGEKVFIFKDVDGDPYDISAIEFELRIKKSSTSISNLVLLTIGSGIVISGNGLTVSINETQSDQPSDFSYWELYNITSDETWINGNAYFITQSDSADNTVEVTINLAVEAVTVTVQNSGSSSTVSQFRGNFNPTGGLLPETGGSGTGGSVKGGDHWKLTDELTISGKSYSVGSIIFAGEDDPGQDITKWSVLATQL